MEVDNDGGGTYDDSVWPFHRDALVRLMLRSLTDMGHAGTVRALEAESGCKLETDDAAALQEVVQKGDWRRCMELLAAVEFSDPEGPEKARIFLLRQQYLELLEARCLDDALACLRTQLACAAALPPDELHALAALIVCPDVRSLREASGWSGTRAEPLREIKRLASPAQFVPSGRLEELVGQALEHQASLCAYHNMADDKLGLYEDHRCGSDLIPRSTTRVLEMHTDEVWCLEFSHRGTLLATASADRTIAIWDLSIKSVPVLQVLRGHQTAPHTVSWSPDDEMLLSCGEHPKVLLWQPRAGTPLGIFDAHTDAVTAVAWMPDGRHFVSGGLDRKIVLWNVGGQALCSWHGTRVHSLCLIPVGESGCAKVFALCGGTVVRTLLIRTASAADGSGAGTASNGAGVSCGCGSFGGGSSSGGDDGGSDGSRAAIAEVSEAGLPDGGGLVLEVKASRDGRHLLMQAEGGRIHLWDVAEQRVVGEFTGHRQGRYMLHATFGGRDDAFVASGSEDSRVHIWNRATGSVVAVLPGHSGTVSAVAWNPADPHVLATASDDRTVRVWGLRV